MPSWARWTPPPEVGAAATPDARGPLAGRMVLVTRPREQALGLRQRIEAAGARALLVPTLEIVDPPQSERLHALLGRLDQFDLVIFISPTAVKRGLALIRARGGLPASLKVAAIGEGTARELRRHGVEAVIVPAGAADSEALLALPQFSDLRGASVVIVRGVGGRALLGATLAQRGANVAYAECYQRVRPSAATAGLGDALKRGEVHAITAMSREALANLLAMVSDTEGELLRATPLFVSHARIALAARELGMQCVIVTDPGDEGMVSALVRHFATAV